MTNVVCIKVNNLRKIGYENLEEWLANPDNIYTGRSGRIFITENGIARYFAYNGSKWQNPYSLKHYSNQESLILYVYHLLKSNLIYDIDELRGKNLGCFCSKHKQNGIPTCHAQVLAELLDKCYELVKKLKEEHNTIPQYIVNLASKISQNIDKIHHEVIKNNGRKITHWAWWVFPTSKTGLSEPPPPTKVENEKDAMSLLMLLDDKVCETWIQVLQSNKICSHN